MIPDTPRDDIRPCRGCMQRLVPARHLRRRERRAGVTVGWRHANPALVCPEREPIGLQEWEQEFATWRGITVAELHREGYFAAVCSCKDDPKCTGYIIVDVHTAAMYCDEQLANRQGMPKELW